MCLVEMWPKFTEEASAITMFCQELLRLSRIFYALQGMLQKCQTGTSPAPSLFWTLQPFYVIRWAQNDRIGAYFSCFNKVSKLLSHWSPFASFSISVWGFPVAWLQEKVDDEHVLCMTWARHCPDLRNLWVCMCSDWMPVPPFPSMHPSPVDCYRNHSE